MMPNEEAMKDLELRRVLREVLVVQLGVGEEQVMDADVRLAADLGADSLDMVEILMAVEEVLGIAIPDDDFDGAGAAWRSGDFTFGQLVAFVEKYQEAA